MSELSTSLAVGADTIALSTGTSKPGGRGGVTTDKGWTRRHGEHSCRAACTPAESASIEGTWPPSELGIAGSTEEGDSGGSGEDVVFYTFKYDRIYVFVFCSLFCFILLFMFSIFTYMYKKFFENTFL